MEKNEVNRMEEVDLPSGVLAAAVSPDANQAVVGCLHGVYRLDLESGKHDRLYQHDSYVSSVAWLGENGVVTAGYDGELRWFDLVTDTFLRRQKVHEFWSWDMTVSPDQMYVASVTGQYIAGGYKYEPQAEKEPSIRVLAAATGEVLWSLPHVPSVQAVAISPDSKWVAAGNLMGEVRVYSLDDGSLEAQWTTPEITSRGIIKSHC